ncbi:hypothetical protein M9Y10_011781 [Tritrichomonas musculus]|uniref:Uncharacterized protein n=1 Tax=Tritrichomonas musculus TaxID=1915356 RepID=A0ABR2IK50_9EUKA
MILLLIQNNLLKIDSYISEEIIKSETDRLFFYPEIKPFLKEETIVKIEELIKKDPNLMNSFELKRDKGENDSYISKLIRQDLIAEFVAHVNQANISLSETIITPSIFETNSFLLDKEPTLIEYAAFF